MSTAIYLCTSSNAILWAFGQIILSISVLQWFFLLQKFARGSEIKSYQINAVGGHVASFFCLVPYNQWRFLNCQNTRHTPRAEPIEKKFFPPLNVLAYSIKNYWNIKKLFHLFPDTSTRFKFLISILVMNCFFWGVIPSVHHFWSKFGIGYLLFLVLAERWLTKKEVLRPSHGPEL